MSDDENIVLLPSAGADVELCKNKTIYCQVCESPIVTADDAPLLTEIQRLRDELERKDQKMHDAYEVYAGMEGFEPKTAPEAYLEKIVTDMAKELCNE